MLDSLQHHGLHAAHQASLSFTGSSSFFKLMSIEVVIPSKHILCCPLLLLPSVFPSIKVVSNELAFHNRWPNYWIVRFSVSPSSEYSELICLRIDWMDLAVHGTLKSLLQHLRSKASNLQYSAFFMIQLAHPYMTAGKTIAVTRWTLSAKKCLCFLICCLGLSYLFFQGAHSF